MYRVISDANKNFVNSIHYCYIHFAYEKIKAENATLSDISWAERRANEIQNPVFLIQGSVSLKERQILYIL